jgi:predicted RNA-binding protein with PUA-like domain
MQTMKVGDRAFFYHSSCKVPGIVGIVEVGRGRLCACDVDGWMRRVL